VIACIDVLLEITRRGGLVLDSDDRIFSEYVANLSFAGHPGTGDFFMKWVHDHRWNEELCERRDITCKNESEQDFEQFPDHPELRKFDVSDRKFVATANAGKAKATILQAVDFKWWGWKDALAACDIPVHFINEGEAESGYRKHLENAG
jgi:hypothetical protein